MKILLLGKNGQLGWELQRTLAPLGPLSAFDYEELNLEDFEAVRSTIRALKPQDIVNASAYTAVDRAENETEKCFAINASIPAILAEEALQLKAALIHYSTDYVFDGLKGSPYSEQDTPKPPQRLWKKQAGRRTGHPGLGRHTPHLPHRLGLQHPPRQLCNQSAAVGASESDLAHCG